jgi:hypothetical protein
MPEEDVPDIIPEQMAYIVWSSLLSKDTGNRNHKRSTAIAQKKSRKSLYLYMHCNNGVNINILTNG